MMKHKQPEFHYLLVNVWGWQSGVDLHALMKKMDGMRSTYWVWYVPGDEAATYEINFYQPQVEGSFLLAEVNPPEKKRRVKR